jgi:hypothetical protein
MIKQTLVIKRTLVVAVGLWSLLASVPASAQISRTGETFAAYNGLVRGTDVAYDSRNGVYLVVGAHGAVIGRFISADGQVLGEQFQIQSVVTFGQFPHVAYSPDANGGNGGFLVTWHESAPNVPPSLHTRMVAYSGGSPSHVFLGPVRQSFGNDTYWEIMGAPVAYSTVTREFLVIWRQYLDTNIFGLRLNNAGETIGGVIPVATSPAFDNDPSLAYNPTTDEFLAVYHSGLGVANVLGQRIKAGTGALVGPPSLIAQALDVRTTGVTYNAKTGRYMVAWHQLPQDAIMGRVVAANGAPVGNVTPLSTRFGTYDSLSIAANETSGTTLLVGHDKLSVEVGAAEVNGSGTPYSAGMLISAAGGRGNFYPRVGSAGSGRREWLMVAANQFARAIGQRVSTGSNDGGGGDDPQPDTRMSLDAPVHGATVGDRVTVSGWALDLNGGTGSGVDAVHVYATPVGGAPYLLGAATFMERPDVASAYGQPRFLSAGFTLTALLAPGWYDITAYARSVVSGTFNTARTARVRVVAAPNPRMAIDTPTWSQVVGNTFTVAGWSLDLASTSGPGIDAVHAWAYPIVGGQYQSPVWVGAATLGLHRPDVAAWWGRSDFTNSGFSVTQTLPSGTYDVVAASWSNVAGGFNYYVVVRIRIP